MKLRKYPEYIDTGLDWLVHIPSNWQLKRLGTVFKERREKVSDTDYPALSVTKSGIVPQLENAAKTDAGDNRKRVAAGDFVINSRSDRKGSSGLSALDGSVSLISIVLQPTGINGLYAHYLLRSQPFQEEFYRFGKGIVADLWSTNYSEMKNISLPMPNGFEQRQIATFLNRETAKIDRLIEKQQRLIELLEEKRQAVISHAVTKGLNPDTPMKDSGVEWLGDVPEHWGVAGFKKYMASIVDYRGKTPIKTDDGIFLVTARNIKNGTINYNASREYVSETDYEEIMSRGKPVLGDVLFTTEAPLGEAANVDREDIALAQRVIKFSGQVGRLDNTFLKLYILSTQFQQGLMTYATGSTALGIKAERLSYLRVVLPPLEEQAEIVKYIQRQLAKFDSLSSKAKSAINLLKERRTALISAAVTGKIDVRDQVPQDVEEAVAS